MKCFPLLRCEDGEDLPTELPMRRFSGAASAGVLSSKLLEYLAQARMLRLCESNFLHGSMEEVRMAPVRSALRLRGWRRLLGDGERWNHEARQK